MIEFGVERGQMKERGRYKALGYFRNKYPNTNWHKANTVFASQYLFKLHLLPEKLLPVNVMVMGWCMIEVINNIEQ